MFSADDHHYMSQALRLAARGLFTTDPNPRVGCVIIKDNEIVGEGWHMRAGQPHAEIAALVRAGERARGGTVYVTLEPCSHHGKTPPCADALIKAGIARVICAQQDPNPEVNGQGIERLRAAGIEVLSGLLSAQAEALNPGFFSRMQRNRPYIRIKTAMSLDGRTALSSGVSQWISGKSARVDVQRWRARSSAIMTGINTVLTDDPALTLRMEVLNMSGEIEHTQSDLIRNPLRIILDSHLKIPLNARLLRLPGDVLIVTSVDDAAKREALSSDNVEVITLPKNTFGRPNLLDLMNVLADAQINEVLVESGHVLTGALLRAQLVDEIILYVAPTLLGESAKGLFELPVLSEMRAKTELVFTDIRAIGPDLRILAKPKYTEVE
ncbi:MAG: bifunctional diaminohydroxyphosphoribosylaminopyrimidine deaminase/5-amino-6-(5-phosphoribosylamino)uracil reductase RibD [Gammaproteobacteria bacterium]|nr:bifunctional diaminohydroxyphosphoribosylaminopyrimidine deaminase/5-amino-6-(5-phosphoribosylamino)uracil reductase RibD [Gammaproteobacteria bacterium]